MSHIQQRRKVFKLLVVFLTIAITLTFPDHSMMEIPDNVVLNVIAVVISVSAQSVSAKHQDAVC